MQLVVGAVLSYLIGSIPTAYLVGKANGVDLRTVGSGNLGATNVFRTLGWKAGAFVYVADMLKGLIPVLVVARLSGVVESWPWAVVFGVAAIVGHVKSIFLVGSGGGGGKGIATASGVFLALAPIPFLIAFASFVVVVAFTRYVSLGSLVGATFLTIAMFWQQRGADLLFYVSAAVAAFVFWTHRENIVRLRNGTERRIDGKKSGNGDGTA